MTEKPPIEAYGLTQALDAQAVDGLVIVRVRMRGGEDINIAMHPVTSANLRQLLQKAELAIVEPRTR